MHFVIACRHKHKKHKKDHTEDEGDVIITDEDSLRHGRQVDFVVCEKSENFPSH